MKLEILARTAVNLGEAKVALSDVTAAVDELRLPERL